VTQTKHEYQFVVHASRLRRTCDAAVPHLAYEVIQKKYTFVQVSKPTLSVESMATAFAGGRYSPFEEEADDENIWHSLCQPAARTQVPRQADGKRAFEVSHHSCTTHTHICFVMG